MAVLARYNELRKEIDALITENEELKQLVLLLRENQDLRVALNDSALVPTFESTRISEPANQAFLETSSWDCDRSSFVPGLRLGIRQRRPADRALQQVQHYPPPPPPGGGAGALPRAHFPIRMAMQQPTARQAPARPPPSLPMRALPGPNQDDGTTAEPVVQLPESIFSPASPRPRGYCFQCPIPWHPHVSFYALSGSASNLGAPQGFPAAAAAAPIPTVYPARRLQQPPARMHWPVTRYLASLPPQGFPPPSPGNFFGPNDTLPSLYQGSSTTSSLDPPVSLYSIGGPFVFDVGSQEYWWDPLLAWNQTASSPTPLQSASDGSAPNQVSSLSPLPAVYFQHPAESRTASPFPSVGSDGSAPNQVSGHSPLPIFYFLRTTDSRTAFPYPSVGSDGSAANQVSGLSPLPAVYFQRPAEPRTASTYPSVFSDPSTPNQLSGLSPLPAVYFQRPAEPSTASTYPSVFSDPSTPNQLSGHSPLPIFYFLRTTNSRTAFPFPSVGSDGSAPNPASGQSPLPAVYFQLPAEPRTASTYPSVFSDGNTPNLLTGQSPLPGVYFQLPAEPRTPSTYPSIFSDHSGSSSPPAQPQPQPPPQPQSPLPGAAPAPALDLTYTSAQGAAASPAGPATKPKERRGADRQATSLSSTRGPRDSRQNTLERIIGEIAFQLDRRILSSIFPDRIRLYGYTVENIPEKITQGGSDPLCPLTPEQCTLMMTRYNSIMEQLQPLGYNPNYHPQFTEHIVNTYGILQGRPDANTDADNYNDVNYLWDVIENVVPANDKKDCLTLLNSLKTLSQADGRPLFIW